MSSENYLYAVETCNRHAKRMQWAKDTLQLHVPFSGANVTALSNLDHAVLEQFTTRFSKLQDAMGAKLFPGLLDLVKEPSDSLTFVDKLNRLEKLGVLDSTAHWLLMREMRNQFAHDYPMESDVQAALLNRAFSLADDLVATFNQIETFAQPYV